MGVRIIHGDDMAVMYCSTTDWAFGPAFYDTDEHDAAERVECFLRWLKKNGRLPSGIRYDDPRQFTDFELESKYTDWRAQEEEQWKAEEKVEED